MATTYYVDAATGSDSNAGTSTGAAFLTIAHAFSVVASGDTVYIKAGTYVQTTVLSIAVATLSVIGYGVTPGDNGTKPLITTATNSTVLFNTGSSTNGLQIFKNLSLSNTASTRASGIWQLNGSGSGQIWVFVDCIFDGFVRAIDSSNGTPFTVAFIYVVNTEIKNCSGNALDAGGSSPATIVVVVGCYFHANAVHMQMGVSISSVFISHTIFAGSTGTFGVNISTNVVTVDACTFANNSNSSGTLSFSSSATFLMITNNIFYGTTGQALQGVGTTNIVRAAAAAGRCNAFGNNGTNYNVNWNGSPGDVTLTANPFTSSGTGDYSLNSTAGGGAACKGAGLPGIFQGATSTGHLDIGAVQSAGGGGGGGGGGGAFTFLG